MADVYHSRVAAALQDQRYVGLRCAEALGYFSLGQGACKRPDSDDVIWREQSGAAHAANVDGVLFVAPVIDPLKVRHDVVGFAPVDVIDHGQGVRVWDEGACNEPVDQKRPTSPFAVKIDLLVSECVSIWKQNSTLLSLRPVRLENKTVETSHLPEIADFVNAFEAGDADPIFSDHLMPMLAAVENTGHYGSTVALSQ